MALIYLRFTSPETRLDSGLESSLDSGVADGVLRRACALRHSDGVPKLERGILSEQLEWFARHLPAPKRFAKGVAWLRDDAIEPISRMFEIKRVLGANGHVVRAHAVRENRVGYIVYQDDAQIVAEPFTDTFTSVTFVTVI